MSKESKLEKKPEIDTKNFIHACDENSYFFQ